MKTITVLSGKGGVGKSSITASLAVAMSKENKIICADCDVDASNLALVLGVKEKDYSEWKDISTNQKVRFDLDKCGSCRKCVDNCYFNAIDWINNRPRLREYSCEGCGVCEMLCPQNAISPYQVKNAKLGHSRTRFGFDVVSAQLKMGESGSGKVVSEVRSLAAKSPADIVLVDAAAGIGCPVIASVVGSDYIIAVTEPSPSAFSDLKRALRLASHFRIPCGIIVNKFDLNKSQTGKILRFARRSKIDVLAKIPYDKSFTYALVNLEPLIVYDRSYTSMFHEIRDKVKQNIGL
ncbi:MAG: ATP-binding protein [Nanoarchaeota archaeon]|nr:ATP-binding protein [Nanoarchaeota archaeon]